MKLKRTIILSLMITIFVLFSFNCNLVYAEENANLNIYSQAVVIIENRTGQVLYEKNADKKMYPASTTKILTAIIVLEKGNLEDKVKVSKTAIADMKSYYTSADLIEGEIITVKELLTVLLVKSANDASNVLAEYISGSMEKFVELMNEKLKELGCNNTHFVTTNGLHDDNHYTTAKDMAIIARYCMQNATFRKIVSMQNCKIPATNKSEERYYKNTNDLVNPASVYYYQPCVGIKTGFTSEARNCLISAASKNGINLIAVVLGADTTENKQSARYVDTKTLFEYAFNTYSYGIIAKASEIVDTIQIKNATKETKNLDIKLENDVSALAKIEDLNNPSNIEYTITYKENLTAPIAQNSVVGTITYTTLNKTYTTNLLASHYVEESHLTIWILRFALIFVILIIFLVLIIKIVKYKKNKN